MIEKEKHIPERLANSTKYNSSELFGHDYSEDVLVRSISTRPLLANPRLAKFIHKLQEMATSLVDEGYTTRNFWDHSVDKNYNKHTT